MSSFRSLSMGKVDPKCGETIVKVFTQLVIGYGLINVDICCGQDSDIHIDGRFPTQAEKLFVL